MAIRFQPNHNQVAQQPQASELVPMPALGNYLSRRHTETVIDVHTQVKDASITCREFLLKSIAQIIAGIALVIFGALSIHTGVGVLAIIAGAGVFLDGLRNAYGAFYARNVNVADEATHALVEHRVRHPELAVAGNGARQQQIEMQPYRPFAGNQFPRPQPFAPAPQAQRVGGFPAFGAR